MQATRQQIEELALKLYDALNPEPDKVVRVSKDECIRRAKFKLNSSRQ